MRAIPALDVQNIHDERTAFARSIQAPAALPLTSIETDVVTYILKTLSPGLIFSVSADFFALGLAPCASDDELASPHLDTTGLVDALRSVFVPSVGLANEYGGNNEEVYLEVLLTNERRIVLAIENTSHGIVRCERLRVAEDDHGLIRLERMRVFVRLDVERWVRAPQFCLLCKQLTRYERASDDHAILIVSAKKQRREATASAHNMLAIADVPPAELVSLLVFVVLETCFLFFELHIYKTSSGC